MNRSCGAFENGICKSYHSAIINQLGEPIITMFEDISIYLMQRLVIMSDKAREPHLLENKLRTGRSL